MHQKRLSTLSKLSTASNTGIKNQFLNAYYYKNTCQISKKRNVLYNNYCQDLQKQYISLRIMSDFLTSKIKINNGGKLNFVQEFKIFIIQFFGIINEVSAFQIQYFHEIQFGQEEKLTNATHSLIQKLKIYDTSQKQFQASRLKQKIIVNQIQTNYQSIKKDSNDPAIYYHLKHMASKSKSIIEALERKAKLNQQIRKDLDEIFENSEQFEKQIVFYRQSFLNNKYKVMRKLIQLSKSGKSSLTQLIVYLFDCVTKKVNDFQNKLKASSQGVIRSKHKSTSNQGDQNFKLQDYIIHITQEYNSMIQQLQQLLKYLSEALQGYSKRSKQNQFKKEIMELLNKLYEADQCPNNQILETLYLYNFFSMKVSDIVTSIYSGYDNLMKLRNNVKKHAEITLALIRCNPYKDKPILQKNNQKQKADGNAQIQELLEQMSNDYPISIIEKVYKSFQQTLSYLKNYISTKFHKKKRHIQDSMQISHIQETIIKPQKRPSKNQIWLWGKWQNQNDYKLSQQKINEKEIRSYLAQFQQKIPEAIQKDKYNCSLTNRKDQKGVLTVFDKYLKFQASNASFSLIINLKDIEDVQIAVKVFNKVLVVTTGNGQLIFSSLINIQEALQEIQHAVSASGNSHPKQTRVVVTLSEEQLTAIEQRKIKIKAQLPNLDQMKLIGELTIENFSVDHLYDLVYSDKPVKVKGKQQPCFMAYVMKKGNASNYEATKYDSVGPKFYTHEQGINFINAPEYSCRTINYDVKLPPIPFMNPYAHNTQQCKIFWISNEQFQYLNIVKTTGAPGQGCFYVSLVDKITKVDKNVKIQVFYRIVWTNSTSLKSFIQSKATEQSKVGVESTLKEIKKYVQNHRGGTSKGGEQNQVQGQKQGEQDNQKQTQKSDLNVKISKLQNQNKYLIIGLLVILIFNIVYKLFSS